MKNLITLLCFCFFLCACNSTSSNNEEDKNLSSEPPKLSLVCQPETSTIEGAPAHSVHLMFNEEKIKLADILACETFKKENYAQYQMPTDALEACGGWWAGAGEYFYLYQKTNGTYAVNYGQMYEEKETGKYDYTELIQIKKNKNGNYDAFPKHELSELVGVYTLGGHDNSWMLIIKPDSAKLAVTYHVIEGMLPPAADSKNSDFKIGEGKTLKNFQVDFSDMTINSDLGQGQLESIFERERITFFGIPSHQEDVLRLTKNKAFDFLLK
ncbi:MAG: hypothetical protein AB8H03_07120 [Saprospiraceae bacterium]